MIWTITVKLFTIIKDKKLYKRRYIVALGILGNKVGMTQIFTKNGNAVPVTIIKSSPCFITQIKTTPIHGYNAVQLGYIKQQSNEKGYKKPLLGHFSKNNLPFFRFLKEYKVENIEQYNIGDSFSVNLFKVGHFITVSGLTIGKGNTSNIKRHKFGRGPMSHGSKHHRLQGSLGAGTSPGRVFPGKKMPGRVGMDKRTIKSLEILDIDLIDNIIVLKGSVPGKAGNLLSLTFDK